MGSSAPVLDGDWRMLPRNGAVQSHSWSLGHRLRLPPGAPLRDGLLSLDGWGPGLVAEGLVGALLEEVTDQFHSAAVHRIAAKGIGGIEDGPTACGQNQDGATRARRSPWSAFIRGDRRPGRPTDGRRTHG